MTDIQQLPRTLNPARQRTDGLWIDGFKVQGPEGTACACGNESPNCRSCWNPEGVARLARRRRATYLREGQIAAAQRPPGVLRPCRGLAEEKTRLGLRQGSRRTLGNRQSRDPQLAPMRSRGPLSRGL